MRVCTYVAMYTTLIVIAIASFSYQVIHTRIRIAIPLLIASYSYRYSIFSFLTIRCGQVQPVSKVAVAVVHSVAVFSVLCWWGSSRRRHAGPSYFVVMTADDR